MTADTHGQQAREPRLGRIQRAVDAAGEPGLTRTEITALFSRNLTGKLFDELLAALMETGQYETVQRPGRGRPAEVYRRLRPAEKDGTMAGIEHQLRRIAGALERIASGSQGHTDAVQDDDGETWTAFFAQWHKLYGGKWLASSDLILSADVRSSERDPWDGCFLTDGHGGPVSAKSLGRLLTGQLDQPRERYVLHSQWDRHSKIRTWQVEEL